MRRALLGAAVGTAMFAGAAGAADLPEVVEVMETVPVRTFSWTGAYVGANAGYAWGNSKWDLGGGGRVSNEPSGFIGGLQVGGQYQFSNGIVAGAEFGWQWLNADDTSGCPNPGFRCTTQVDWMSDIRARLGYGYDRFLIYAAGGFSFADLEIKVRPGVASKNTTATGWNIGGGLEYAVTDAIVLGLEYKYTDLGETTFKNVGGVRVKDDVTFSTVSARVAYKFGSF